jgi:hypothetical protein
LRSDLWLLIIRLREETSTRSCIGWRIWGSGATGRRWSWSILRRCGLGRYPEERKVQIRGELLGKIVVIRRWMCSVHRSGPRSRSFELRAAAGAEFAGPRGPGPAEPGPPRLALRAHAPGDRGGARPGLHGPGDADAVAPAPGPRAGLTGGPGRGPARRAGADGPTDHIWTVQELLTTIPMPAGNT